MPVLWKVETADCALVIAGRETAKNRKRKLKALICHFPFCSWRRAENTNPGEMVWADLETFEVTLRMHTDTFSLFQFKETSFR